MNKTINITLGLCLFFFSISINSAKAQLTYTDDFSANKGTTQVTSGLMGTSGANNWFVTSSGADWGAIRNDATSQLELTNDVGATANVNGWVFAQTVTQHHPTLNLNTDVTWSFNMRQITTDPGGFAAGSHGVAFVLAGSSVTAATAGQGYAVVLGQTGTTDPVRLVHYNNGLQGTLTNIVTSNTTGLTDFGAEYLSVKVVYTASTDTWQLFLRNDGATAFADPSTGTLTSQGTPVANNTATSTPLSFMGAYWQGGTAANQTAFFDNVKVVANTGAFVTTWVPGGTATSLTIPVMPGSIFNYAATCQNMTTGSTAATTLTGQTNNATFSSLTATSTYRVFITGFFTAIYFNGGTEAPKLRTIEQWGTRAWGTMFAAFKGCTNLTTAKGTPVISVSIQMYATFAGCTNFNGDISGWNTAMVTDMSSMFNGCTNFNSDISGWNTGNVTDMNYMFSGCTNFNGNITGWNTAKVTNMSNMFRDASAFNKDIGTWTTTAVTNMSNMFYGCTNFNGNITAWNTAAVTNMSYMFQYATNFNKDIGTWNTAKVTNMSYMFSNCTNFNGNIAAWTTTAVTNMSYMFESAPAFNQNIGTWNTAAVTNMGYMFYGCTNFNANIAAWNTAKVTNMSFMFGDARAFNQNISTWTTTAVTNMVGMFVRAIAFNQPIGTWTTTAVTNMSAMFYEATAFNQNLGTWNTAAVTNMSNMFYGCTNFNGNIIGWNTAAVTNMSNMFLRAPAFNQAIGTWNTAAVTDMNQMFFEATAFNQNLGAWTLNANVNLGSMLNSCGMDCTNYSATLATWAVKTGLPTGRNLGATGRKYGTDAVTSRSTLTTATTSGGKGWAISDGGVSTGACLPPEINVQGNSTNIVDGSTTPSATNHTDFGSVGVGSTLVRTYTIQNTGLGILAISSITSNNTKFVIGTAPTSIATGASATFTVTYTPTATGTDNATITINNNDSDEAVYDFAITGTAFTPFTTRWNLATAGSGTTQLSFGVLTVAAGTVAYTWKSTTTSASGSGTFTGTTCTITSLPTGQTILLSIAPTNFQRFNMNNGTDKSRLTAIESWGDVAWTSMATAFYGCNNLTTATGNPTLTSVTDMTSMFQGCALFNANITGWNTAAVTNMSSMFNGCTLFNGDITGWNTAAVTNMSSMFNAAAVFNQDISTWNTVKVTNMSSMFQSASAFNRDISTWNTAAVTNMGSMFQSATVFNRAIGTWTTSAVTNMAAMFSGATAFNQNLGAWTLNANVVLTTMLNSSGMDCTNYSNTLAAWAVKSGLPTGRSLGATGIKYGTDAAAARTVLTTATTSGGKGWTISDGGVSTGACLTPEIIVQGSSTNIADGSTTPSATNHTDFGSVGIGSTLVRTFTIQNLGFGALTISSITSNNTKFVIGTAPTSIAAGASATFTVTYTPTATGTDNATITINNNDSDEAVYDFAITGTAVNAFITRWNLATAGSSTTGITFGAETSGIVAYTWQSTTTSASGSGTFTGTTCTITALPTGQAILLSIAPTNFQRFNMSYGADRSRLIAIEAWGDVAWTNMSGAFAGCRNLTTATGNPTLTGVTNMSAMFNDCSLFNGNITGWNTAAVTDMSYMFYGCPNFNANISGWNTAAVTNMNVMFVGCTNFNANISGWNTANVTNMSGMFSSCTNFNADISGWNTAKVTNMSSMFQSASAFNKDISTWTTSAVTDMGGMFNGAIAFNKPIGTWTTSAVTQMGGMFIGATAFNQNLGNWTLNANVNLVNMLNTSGMDCTNYSATLAVWAAKPGLPTGRSLGATGRPYGTDAVAARNTLTTAIASGGKGWTITGDVASTSACLFPEINVQGNSTNILDGTTVPSATNHTDFGSVGIGSTLVRTFTIQNTGTAALTISSVMSSSTKFVIGTAPTSIAAGATATFTVTYTPTATGTDNATITINNNDSDEAVYDFAITGTAINPFITRWNLATAGSTPTELTFSAVTSGTVSYTWKSTTTTASGSGTFTGTTCTITGLPTGETILLSIAPTNFQSFIMMNGSDAPRLTAIEAWGDVAWTSMNNAFAGCTNLTTVTGNPILTGVTNMSNMFYGCTLFNGDITGWNTATVTDMSFMFYDARAFNQPIGIWNTAAVTNMSFMFGDAHAFNRDISTWNTEKVVSMSYMFYNAYAFNQPIGIWKTEKVGSMASMFNGASTFNQPIGTWNTAAVTEMGTMFAGAIAFNQPIGTWNTAAVGDMGYMFYGAAAFNQNLGNWSLSSVYALDEMLSYCSMDCGNYSATLVGWAAQSGLPSRISFGASDRQYGTDAIAAHNTLDNIWFITDNGTSGVACIVPEINVQGNSTNIADGSTTPSSTNHTDFGTVSTNLVRTFTIQNTGVGVLTIGSISTNNAKFSIPTAPASVAAGSSVTFTVRYTPITSGTDNAIVTINNNDSDEAAYRFAVIGTSNAVLPVELLDFTGAPSVKGNLLTWRTANEVNNKGFQVERRQTTADTWDAIGFITANNKASNYQFLDDLTFGKLETFQKLNYYRLRQIDNDGKETLSKVVAIQSKSNDKMKVYPNPVSNTLTIESSPSGLGAGDYHIFNLLGQEILRGPATAQRIDVSALPQGSYILKMGSEQVKFNKL